MTDRAATSGGREAYIESFSDRAVAEGWPSCTVRASGDSAVEEIRSDSAFWPPDVFFLHDPKLWPLARRLSDIAPCVGWEHSYTSVCPGGMSWYPASGNRCDLHTGPCCVSNAYRQRCAPRHPGRLARALRASASARLSERHLAAIFVGSTAMEERLIAAGFPAPKVTAVPYFQRWSPDVAAQGSRSLAGTELDDRPVVLCLSRLHEAKGVHVLIRAMGHLETPCQLVIAGVGPPDYVAALRSEAERVEGDGVTVRFILDHGRDVDSLYRAATVVAVPSLWPEPFGLVGPEAMMFERPIVAFEGGGTSEWMRDEMVGLVAAAGDEVDLARKLDRVLSSPVLAEELGARGREMAERQFVWEAHFGRLRTALADHGVPIPSVS